MAPTDEIQVGEDFSTKKSFGAKIKRAFLGDASQSKFEKRLVRKLDFYILTFCCVTFFFNYLDRAAFANAYVSGMSVDLKLTGNQYSYVLSITTAGYVIGQLPHGVIIQKIAPRIWLPSMVVVWATLTMCTAAVKTYHQLMAVRFILGAVEASTYCGTLYIIGSWYKPLEIAKRTAIFTASGQAGTMFAGVMMTAINKGMSGYSGLAGWQWVFLIDGIITFPIAIMGFLCFPDTPELTKAPFLSREEVKLALDRLPPKKADGHNIDPLSLAKRVLFSPAFWILISFSVICTSLEAFCTQNLMLLWLTKHKETYSTTQRTMFPLGISAVGIVSNFSAAIFIDATGKRLPMGFLAAGLQTLCSILLLVPSMSHTGILFAFYLAGSSYIVNPLLFGWANVICQRGGDDALRSVTLYAMNASASILYTFWGIALYPATDAPYWKKGAIAMICMSAVMAAMLFVVRWLDHYTIRQADIVEGVSYEVSSLEFDDVTVKEKEKDLFSKGAVADTTGAMPVIVS